MTLQERITAQRKAADDAFVIQEMINKLSKAKAYTETNMRVSDIPWGYSPHIIFRIDSMHFDAGHKFSNLQTVMDISPYFRSFAADIDAFIKTRAATLIAELTRKADSLLSPPTVTVVSNGVNVEVK